MTADAAASLPDGIRSKASRLAAGVLVAAGGVCWLAPLFVLVAIVPRFGEIFEKSGIEGGLPGATAFALGIGSALGEVGLWILALWLVLVLALAAAAALAPWRLMVCVSAILLGLCFVGSVAATTATVVALFLPMAQLMQQVGSG